MINDWPLEYRLVYFSGSVAGHQGATQEDADHVAHSFDAEEEEIRFLSYGRICLQRETVGR